MIHLIRRRSHWGRAAVLGMLALAVLLAGLLGGCAALEEEPNRSESGSASYSTEHAALTGFDEVAAYIAENGQLPDNFITKAEARKLGWDAQQQNLWEVAPGKSIGGDVFGNREGLLPAKPGRKWYEADIQYGGGGRGADRIVYSNDGLIYQTTDHYKSFTAIVGEE